MNIIIYTIKDCPFCQAEKDYLTALHLPYQEKNVEESKENLGEMLKESDNFAGVPFTLITKDDGTKLTFRGFTEADFKDALNPDAKPAGEKPEADMSSQPVPISAPMTDHMSEPSSMPVPDMPAPSMPIPAPVVPEPVIPEPVIPAPTPSFIEPEPMNNPVVNQSIADMMPPAPVSPMAQPPEPVTVAPQMPPAVTPPIDDQLNSVLNSLNQMSQPNNPPAAPANDTQTPSIPDFPKE